MAVRAVSVRKAYGDRSVLADLDLEIRRGEFVALLGASGSGKTTFLRVLAGLEPLDGGTLSRAPRRTVVFQEPRLVPSKRVADNVALGQRRARQHRGPGAGRWRKWGWTSGRAPGPPLSPAARRSASRWPERWCVSRACCCSTSRSPRSTRSRGCGCRRWSPSCAASTGPAVLLVTHDVDEAILLADRVLVLRDGRVASEVVVPFPRPRRRGVPGFGDLRRALLGDLGVVEAIGAA